MRLINDGLSWKLIKVWKCQVYTAPFFFSNLLFSSFFLRIISIIATDSLEFFLVIFSKKIFGHFISYEAVCIIDPEWRRDLYKFAWTVISGDGLVTSLTFKVIVIFVVPECMLTLDEKEICLLVIDRFYLTKVTFASWFYFFYCEIRSKLIGYMLRMFNHITINMISKDEYAWLENLHYNNNNSSKMANFFNQNSISK